MIRPIRTFTVSPSLPPELERQRALVYNLRWAWNHDAIELFRWDGDLWEQSGHNPALMLGTIDQGTLQAAASDEGFLARLNRVSNDFDAYLKSESAVITEARTSAEISLPSLNSTTTRSAAWTMCAAVITFPSAEIKTPEPIPGVFTNSPFDCGLISLSTVRTVTTEAL